MGTLGTEIKWLKSQYVIDFELEYNWMFLCDLKATIYCTAGSCTSKSILQCWRPCALVLVDATATQLALEDQLFCRVYRNPFILLVHSLFISYFWGYLMSCFHTPDISRTGDFLNVFLCYQYKSQLVMKLAASLHQFSYLAAFCIWFCRKCKSSSWPALLSLLPYCWESLQVLIVHILLPFTLEDKIFTECLWNLCSFKNIPGQRDRSWKNTLIPWFQ